MGHALHCRDGLTVFLAVAFIAAVGCDRTSDMETGLDPSAQADRAPIPLAVLGDSDNHSYGDEIWFPAGGAHRGGPYRRVTLQWTEVIERLRASEIDQGRWGTWGVHPRLARVAGLAGVNLRAPRKQDYEYNFAFSGAVCGQLTDGGKAQTPRLLRLMQRDPARWRDGIVQIRIGINTLGTRAFLERAASEGLTDDVAAEVHACADSVVASARTIRQAFPRTRIVLVGILNNSDWPPYFRYWRSPAAQQNINSVLDAFDSRLAAFAFADAGMAFFDDRAWFARYWGGRDAAGRPAYASHVLAGRFEVRNTQGDAPLNGILEDGHAGTIANAIWARDFIDFLNEQFGLDVSPVTEAELLTLAESVVEPW